MPESVFPTQTIEIIIRMDFPETDETPKGNPRNISFSST
jgi:hypothetical protein